VVFLLSLIALGVILLSTSFRHRARRWIRRNIFAGKYDYRFFWMEAIERVRASDAPETTAAELAGLLQRALGSVDLTVWGRLKNSSKLRLLAVRGPPADRMEKEVALKDGSLDRLTDPIALSDLVKAPRPAGAPMAFDMVEDSRFLKGTRASFLVPL